MFLDEHEGMRKRIIIIIIIKDLNHLINLVSLVRLVISFVSEIVIAFKKKTVGLVTREQYIEKRVNIRNKFEEEEKEKLQKEEDLQQEKRNKKRKIKGNPWLSFTDDIENESDEDGGDNKNEEPKKHGNVKLGKDPTIETRFLPYSERRQKNKPSGKN